MNRLTFVSATLLASVSLTATAYARPMTPEDVAKVESVGTVVVSPDGSRIAYTTGSLPDVTEGEENGGFTSELSIATAPDVARQFLPDDISPGDVAFSPDGRWLTFTWSKDDEDTAVWGIPVDGGTYTKIAAVEDTGVRSYHFSPDGRTIYMLTGPGEDAQRKAQRDGGFNSRVYEEEFRPARMFAATVGTEIDEEPREIAIPGYVSAFNISADGRMAVVETTPTPLVDDSYTQKRVNVINLSDATVMTVVETPGKIGDVEMSPDTSLISMVAAVDMNDPAATTLYLANSVTGEFNPVNEGAAEAVVDTEWLPDGRLAAVVHVGVQSVLRIYNSNGTLSEEIDPGELILT
ncbi:TolB family protein, partial [Sulfitobacter sp.]|uniref:TolB family protein n=1 Tax=Sulfitobacter sp. TaxID=1903071 RepID=UPI003EF23C84